MERIMYLQEDTSQGQVNVSFDNVYGLGFNLSGGMDSGTLLYTLCESMTAQKDFFPIYCVTACNSTDVFGAYHAGLVFNFVKRKFTKVELYHHVDYSMLTGRSKISRKNKLLFKLYEEEKINANTDGVTRNPMSDDFIFVTPNNEFTIPETKRDAEMPLITKFPRFVLYRPWNILDKKGVREIAERKGIKDKLLSITRSCTDIKKHRCNNCWWCQERKWAYPEEKQSRIQRVLK